MSRVEIIDTNPAFLEEVVFDSMPEFDLKDYGRRVGLLVERMKRRGVTHAVVYGDREHFATIDYLTGYDPRFEESLLIVDADGRLTLLVGNEGWAYSAKVPLEVNRVLYQNFSLQGQPRGKLRPLSEIFSEAGIGSGARVGVVGYKYFETRHTGDPVHTFDIPAYLLAELAALVGEEEVINVTDELTGLPNGIRMTLRTAKEVAWAEYSASKCANNVLRFLGNLKPNVAELELSARAMADASPVSVFPMVNFGPEHVALGIRSPDYRRLASGEVCALCYAIRGGLASRVGVAAYDASSYRGDLGGSLESFYVPFWKAIAAWYETVAPNVPAGEVYDAVMGIIGGPEYGVTLNPGHNTASDEWTNSAFYAGSTVEIPSGSHLQCDIIASSASPVRTAICEDGVVVADEALRTAVMTEYPDVWERIAKRQRLMRTELGINVSDSLLPLSNITGVYWPFMLDTGKIFALR